MITSSLRQTSATHNFKHEPEQFEDFRCYTLEDIRLYENADGILFPSVTHALGDGKKESLDAWRQRVGIEEAEKIGRNAAAIGTRLHTLCEKFLNNDPNYNRSVFPQEAELFAKLRPVLVERVGVVYAQEFPLFSLDLSVAGRCDLFCSFDGVPAVVDFKSSSKLKKEEWIENYFMQATAYSMMLRERGYTVDKFVILVSSPDGVQVFDKHVDDYLEMTRVYFKGFHAKYKYSQQRFREMIGDRAPDER